MADLSGLKPKASYQQLLTLESNEISGSLKKVQDGLGADTSLELSTNVAKVDGNLEVTGTSTLTGNATLTGAATVRDIKVGTDASNEIGTSSGNLILDSAGGTVNITDNADVDGNLNVDGTSTLVGTLNVQGASDFDSNVNMDGNLQLDGTLHVDGASTFDAAMDINAAMDIDGAMDIGSTVQFSQIPPNNSALYNALVVDSSGNLRTNTSLFSSDMFVGRVDGNVSADGDDVDNATEVTSSGVQLHFKTIANSTNTGSYEFGDTNTFTQAGTSNDAIIIGKAGTYRFDVNLQIATSGSPAEDTNIKIDILEKPSGGSFSPIHSSSNEKTKSLVTTESYSFFKYLDATTNRYALKCTMGGTAATMSVVELNSTFTITRIA